MIGRYIRLVFLLLSAKGAMYAQADSLPQFSFNQIYAAAQSEYGIDQGLVNGFLVENNNQEAKGHPYLMDYFSNQGSVKYRGKQYSNLFLRYDIFNQQVLLIYPVNEVRYELYLQPEFITEFSIGKSKFINHRSGANEEARIYQVIGRELPVKLLYYWQKGLTNINPNNPDAKIYSSAQKAAFILMKEQLVSYKRNGSFARRFSSDNRPAIKKYLRKNKIRVNLANDDEMELLVDFINTLEI